MMKDSINNSAATGGGQSIKGNNTVETFGHTERSSKLIKMPPRIVNL